MLDSKNINTHISVDCVVFGFDGEHLKVVLNERSIDEKSAPYNDKKLPGSLIFNDENLDEAAIRVLNELTGLSNIYLSQFSTFGNPERSKNPRDILWLERTTNLKLDRIVTVAYVALIKIDRKFVFSAKDTTASWYDVKDVPHLQLAFDHQQIIMQGMEHLRQRFNFEPYLLFELLPKKFTISQFRALHDVLHQSRSDVRNFQKRVAQMPQLIALDEFQTGVAHRAARLYKYKK